MLNELNVLIAQLQLEFVKSMTNGFEDEAAPLEGIKAVVEEMNLLLGIGED